MVALGAGAATNDLDVARQALRDGFFSLARARVRENGSDEAKLIVLESYAAEGKWREIQSALSSWGFPAGDAYVYYRALAFVRLGDSRAARDLFALGLPRDPVYLHLASRLLADVALVEREPARAADLLEKLPSLEADDKILLAEARSRLGTAAGAQLLWHEVLTDTNASERAIATAAANLGDAGRLRSVVSNAVSVEVQSFAKCRLGTVLLNSPDTFEEGARLIRETVTAQPDAEGAFEASRALAAARLRRSDWQGAAVAYSELLEVWPAAAREEVVNEGHGWALLKLGRAEEALAAFRQAEACAQTDDERAVAAVKVGDALAALGRLDDSAAKYREVLARAPATKTAKLIEEVVRLREREKTGRTLYREFRFAEAQKVFAEVGAGDPMRRGRMSFFEALCLYGQGRDEEAEARARTIVETTDDPRLKADVTQWLARAAYNAGRWREAEKLFVGYAAAPGVSPADVAEARVWAARAALAANDFSSAIAHAAVVVGDSSDSPARAEALIVQGEALLELARFDEAVLVFERAALVPSAPAEIRLEAQTLRADALFAIGADNPVRYEEALAAYRTLALAEAIADATRFSLAYKIGLTLEKLKRKDEAVDQYYSHVVMAYRDARLKGARLDDEARAVFARAAFRLADLCEASGQFVQAVNTLRLVSESDVPAADEALRRIDRIKQKGILP